jgi:predicted transposase/invertase (TIGR01784 family)
MKKFESFTNIPATCDFVFKYIFGSENSTDILKSFINAVQRDSGFPEVTDLVIRNPCSSKTWLKEKTPVVDVLCRDVNGYQFTIEMQARDQLFFAERTLYYWAKAYAGQIAEGDEYTRLKPVIGINIVNFELFPYNGGEYHSFFLLGNGKYPEKKLTNDLVIHYLELPKITKEPRSALEEWNFFIKLAEREGDPVLKNIFKRNPDIAKAYKRYEEANRDTAARYAYEARVRWEMDQRQYLSDAKFLGHEQGLQDGLREGRIEGFAEGRTEGLAKGRTEGLAEGRTEGLAEGRTEGLAEGLLEGRLDTARELKKMGISPETICKATGLTEEDINRL